MNKLRVFDWLQIIANISLVVGLLLVGLQLRQSAELTRIQLLHAGWSDRQNNIRAVMGEEPAKVLAKSWTDGTDFTDEELHIFDAYMINELEYWARTKVLGDVGLFDKDNWRMAFDTNHPSYTGELNWLFATPLSRAWWKTSGGWFKDEEFTRAIQQVVANPIAREDLRWTDQVRKELKRQLDLLDKTPGRSLYEATNPAWVEPGKP